MLAPAETRIPAVAVGAVPSARQRMLAPTTLMMAWVGLIRVLAEPGRVSDTAEAVVAESAFWMPVWTSGHVMPTPPCAVARESATPYQGVLRWVWASSHSQGNRTHPLSPPVPPPRQGPASPSMLPAGQGARPA